MKSVYYIDLAGTYPSPSPRRAWIEIRLFNNPFVIAMTSPSPRRAWIEIMMDNLGVAMNATVALPTEGVD